MKRPKEKESDIQRAILDWLAWNKIFHYRNNSGAMGGVYKGKKWFLRFGASGSPDIICVIKGQFLGIEVKAPKGRQGEDQKEFQRKLELAGGKYILAFSLDDVIRVANNL